MRVEMRTGEGVSAKAVDVWASRIGDPVARLKFLRAAKVTPAQSPRRWRGKRQFAILAALLLVAVHRTSTPVPAPVPAPAPAAQPAAAPQQSPPDKAPRVWLVEKTGDSEIYSNGLRIETRLTVAASPRLYRAFPRHGAAGWRWRSDPAGIVFHSSESDTAEFAPEQTSLLKRQARGLVEYARQHLCYHFVIDRFGRVHRIVQEGSKANHAGHSIWADSKWVYVNLNTSFLGICFEAQTGADQPVSPAQIHSGKVLVEMLRSRYGIPASNCVTHAQVSVNPRNFRVGYHTDWASGFPFARIGLPNNYELPLPSLLLFGFEADSSYVERSGTELREALAAAEQQVREAATTRQLSLSRYEAELRKSYAAILAASGDPATL
jgi:hypothetical protein